MKNVRSLGYILGDEGSAAYIGKRFLSDCLKDIAPAQLVNDFFEYINLSPDEIMSAIYDHSLPSNTLSVYSRFLMDKLDQDYVYRLVRHAIDAFFRRNVLQYDYEGKTVCFVGSNACAYSGVLTEVADSYNIKDLKKSHQARCQGLLSIILQTDSLPARRLATLAKLSAGFFLREMVLKICVEILNNVLSIKI